MSCGSSAAPPGIRSTSPASAIMSNSATVLGASYGTRPNRQWYSVAPREYTSDLKPWYGSPPAHSGDMYAGDPN